MLTLLLVSLYEFKQFLQIVLWIAIPGTVIAIVLTTWLHYRRKKALDNQPDLLDQERLAIAGDMGQLPDWLASADPDNTSLLKKYEREVRRYKENYGTLEQDYRELEQKYSDLLNKAYHSDQNGNEAVDQVQQLRISVAELREENTLLKERMEEQKYMEDLLQEKKLQVEFLQQQLEQRIKNYHQLEKQTDQSTAELQHLRNSADEYNQQAQVLQSVLDEKESTILELENKLEMSSQSFIRIYAELAKSMQAGLVPSQNGHGAAKLHEAVEPMDAATAIIGQAPTVN